MRCQPGLRSLHMSVPARRLAAEPPRRHSSGEEGERERPWPGRWPRGVGHVLAGEDPVVHVLLPGPELGRLDGVVEHERVDDEVRLIGQDLLEDPEQLGKVRPTTGAVAHFHATRRARLEQPAEHSHRGLVFLDALPLGE